MELRSLESPRLKELTFYDFRDYGEYPQVPPNFESLTGADLEDPFDSIEKALLVSVWNLNAHYCSLLI